jgi:hypothetical protein
MEVIKQGIRKASNIVSVSICHGIVSCSTNNFILAVHFLRLLEKGEVNVIMFYFSVH